MPLQFKSGAPNMGEILMDVNGDLMDDCCCCATAPVPVACPGAPPWMTNYLLNTFTVTNGTFPTCSGVPATGSGVMNQVGVTCSYTFSAVFAGTLVQAALSLITVGAGSPYYLFILTTDISFFGPCTPTNQAYRKTIGCDPVGVFTQVAPFNTALTFPATLTVS